MQAPSKSNLPPLMPEATHASPSSANWVAAGDRRSSDADIDLDGRFPVHRLEADGTLAPRDTKLIILPTKRRSRGTISLSRDDVLCVKTVDGSADDDERYSKVTFEKDALRHLAVEIGRRRAEVAEAVMQLPEKLRQHAVEHFSDVGDDQQPPVDVFEFITFLQELGVAHTQCRWGK